MSFFKRLKERCRRKMAAKETVYELGRLSDRELGDLGIARGDIPFIAKKNAKARYPIYR
jgi:uncharacterized protein YjiS (DUF1127 family)